MPLPLRSTLLALHLLAGCGAGNEASVPFARPTLRRADALRPDSPATTEPLPIFSPSETVEDFSLPDASFVVHFSRSGPNAVPAADVNANSVPDYVEGVATTYEQVAAAYEDVWGFRAPLSDQAVPGDNGGDARFDVYLVDFAGRADGSFRRECLPADAGTCTGYIIQENDFAGYRYSSALEGTRVLSSHEYFHAVQAAYDAHQGSVLGEGTAVWATERFDSSLTDFESLAAAYLQRPDKSLEQESGGGIDGFAYGSALFFECLSTRNGDDTVKKLWTALSDNEAWLPKLNSVLVGTTVQQELDECGRWSLFTGARARAGYGHKRASALVAAALEEKPAPLLLDRVRMFGTSSRYYRVTGLTAGAKVWWKPASDAPDGGAAWLRVRTARDEAGPPSFTEVPAGQVTNVGDGANAFVLVSHVEPQAASVPIALCVGSLESVAGCVAPEATDGGITDPEENQGCGCGTLPASGLWLLPLALLLLRRGRGFVAVFVLTVAFPSYAGGSSHAGTDLTAAIFAPDAGRLLAVPSSPDVPELTTIVTGTRLQQRFKESSVATEVLTKTQIRESGARDAAEALQSRPGLEVLSNVGATAVRMQGLGPEYNLILINGQRTVGKLNGGVDLSRLSAEDIEQIEIVKGPASVLWGSDALAGTINIITRKPQRPLGGALTASYGVLNQADVEGAAEASSEKWGVGLSAGYQRRDGYDYDPSTIATNGSSLDGVQTALTGSYGGRQQSGTHADVRVSYGRRVQRGIDQSTAGAIFDRVSRDNMIDALGTVRIPVGDGNFLISTSTSVFDRRYIYDQRGGFSLDDVEDTLDWNVEVQTQVDQRFGNHTVLGGATFLNERLSSPRLERGQGRRGRFSLFAQDEWKPTAKLALVGGARLDVDSTFGAVGTPRVAARWSLKESLARRFSSGLGFRAPTFQELLLDFENPSAGYVINGNRDLRPEHSWGTNLNVDWQATEKWGFSLSGFWNELWDMIGYASTNEGELLRFQYVNISRARSRGLESQVRWQASKLFSVEAGYTLTDARNLTEGTPLEGQASHRAILQARFRHRPWGLTAMVRSSYTGPRPFLTDATVTRSRGYVMVDARVAKTLGSYVELFVSGSNLAGFGDAAELPIPPRNVFGGVTVRY
ncbi:MAG: TonB-dependent receptor plug domain-containing protein [Myxococcaceae bacterium]